MTPRTTFHAQTPLQALLLERALLLAQQLETTANAAPDGRVLAQVEALAVPAARELARQAVQATLQTQAAQAEKRGAGPALPPLPEARLGQGTYPAHRPECRRRRPPGPPLPGLPALPPPRLPARRAPGPDRLGQPPRP